MRKAGMIGWMVAAAIAACAAAQQAPSPRAKSPAAKSGQATLVVSCDVACTWTLDGDDQQPIAAGASGKVRVDPGDHAVVAATEDGNDHLVKEVEVAAGDQEAVQFRLLQARIARLKKELADQQERIKKFQEGGEPTPQPAAEETPQPVTDVKPQPPAEQKPQPATENKPQPATEDNPQPAPAEKPVPTAQPSPAPAAETPRPPETTSAPVPQTTPAATSQPTAPPTPQPAPPETPQPIPVATPQQAPAAEPQPTPAATPQPPSPAKLEIPLAIAEQLLIAKSTPAYPEGARTAGVTGTVVLHATITRDGSLKDLAVVSGPEMLQKAAWDAVSKWKYSPYMVNGQPVEAGTTITMTFKLREPPSEPAPAPQK